MKITCSQILLTSISMFSQNIDELKKQVQTLESVHTLISKYRQAGYTSSAASRIFNLLVCIDKSEEEHLLMLKLLLEITYNCREPS